MLFHVSREASPAERGHEFGRAQADAVRGTVRMYERLFSETQGLDTVAVRAAGQGIAKRLDVSYPELLEEIVGIARGAEVDEATLVAINARTELLAGATTPECSAIGVLPGRSGGRTILAQNWDWHPDIEPSIVVWTIVEPDGRWLSTMTEAGILAKIGLNNRGLGLCLNILGMSLDGGSEGIPVHALMRVVLQHCDDLDSAERLLRAAEVSASSCFNLGSPGALASFEVSPAGATRIEPEADILLHTNHFLDLPGGTEDVYRRDWPDTVARLEELSQRVRLGPRHLDTEAVKRALRSHDAGRIAVCCHDPDNECYSDRQATLASVCLELQDLSFEISDGPPCSTPYQRVKCPVPALTS